MFQIALGLPCARPASNSLTGILKIVLNVVALYATTASGFKGKLAQLARTHRSADKRPGTVTPE